MKKTIILLALTTLIASSVFYISCKKEGVQNVKSNNKLYAIASRNYEKGLSENLVLNYDLKTLSAALEDYLFKTYNGEYMLENVAAFMLRNDSTHSETPILQISCVNIKEERSENNYYVLESVIAKDGSTQYAVNPGGTQFSCIASGSCRHKSNDTVDPLACYPMQDKKGNYYCSKCTLLGSIGITIFGQPRGACYESTSITVPSSSLCEILSYL